jgi:formylglycine-generating enzyme required for sulfatase activity
VKYSQIVWIVAITTALLLTGCGAEEETPPPAPPASEQDDTPASELAKGNPTDVLLGATAVPTPIPVTSTPTPKPLPPSPTPRPTPTPVTVEEDEAAATEEAEPEQAKPVTELVEIPAGPFTMGRDGGADDESPAHEVELPTYYMELFEVTNDQFAAFAEDTGYVTEAEADSATGWRAYADGKGNHPVVKVSWNDAKAYCEWAGRRLPTEPEWEKAARGTEGFLYPWGDDWDPNKANVKESGFRGTTPVGSFAEGTSPYGLFDMAGNVWEWTADWYQPYPGNTVEDPFYGEEFKVLRGGGWFDEPDQVLTTNRSSTSPTAANDDIGFRCASDELN